MRNTSHTPPEPLFSPNAPPGGSSRKIGWIVGVFVCIGLGVLVCCGGGLLFVNFGLDMLAKDIQDQLADTPEFQEHIGTIESFETNFTKSALASDEDTFVYDVEGSKEKGFVTVKHHTDSFGDEAIDDAELTMSDGRKIPIDVAR